MKYLLYFLIVINIVTFFVYGIDKLLAIKHMWRVPEKFLFLLSITGGFVGSIVGMNIFRHKTKKLFFYIWNIISIVIWILIMYYLKK